MKRFHSNGKFLLTGEYLVMAGARGLAVPLKVGQTMDVEENGQDGKVSWDVKDLEGHWFRAEISVPDLKILETDSTENAEYLAKAFAKARELNPEFLANKDSFLVNNYMDFNRDWGMGSSSTFISNLARWAEVNPFELHKKLTSGSGYDIACARADTAILYEKHYDQTSIESVKWNPPFHRNIAFVYLGRKQDSAHSIKNFHELDIKDQDIKAINKISDSIWLTNNAIDFMEKIWSHEEIIGRILKQTPVQDKLFKDFNGAVKSLGAWGGDFVMAVGKSKFKKIQKYFNSKGYDVVLPWNIIF